MASRRPSSEPAGPGTKTCWEAQVGLEATIAGPRTLAAPHRPWQIGAGGMMESRGWRFLLLFLLEPPSILAYPGPPCSSPNFLQPGRRRPPSSPRQRSTTGTKSHDRRQASDEQRITVGRLPHLMQRHLRAWRRPVISGLPAITSRDVDHARSRHLDKESTNGRFACTPAHLGATRRCALEMGCLGRTRTDQDRARSHRRIPNLPEAFCTVPRRRFRCGMGRAMPGVAHSKTAIARSCFWGWAWSRTLRFMCAERRRPSQVPCALAIGRQNGRTCRLPGPQPPTPSLTEQPRAGYF